jgi:hypothetical protein
MKKMRKTWVSKFQQVGFLPSFTKMIMMNWLALVFIFNIFSVASNFASLLSGISLLVSAGNIAEENDHAEEDDPLLMDLSTLIEDLGF